MAAEDPEAIHTLPINVQKGLALSDAKSLALDIGFTGKAADDVCCYFFV